MGIFVFWTERDWSRKSCYGNTIEGVILKVSSRRCAILIVSASRKLMLEYPNSSQLTERYEQQPHAVNYRTEDARWQQESLVKRSGENKAPRLISRARAPPEKKNDLKCPYCLLLSWMILFCPFCPYFVLCWNCLWDRIMNCLLKYFIRKLK